VKESWEKKNARRSPNKGGNRAKKMNESAEERLSSLEASQTEIQSELKSFKEQTSSQLEQILAILGEKSKSPKTPTPGTAEGEVSTPQVSEVPEKALAWKVSVDLLQKELEASEKSLADLDHLRETLETTTEEKQKLEDRFAEVEKEREQYKHEKELLQQKLGELGMEPEENGTPLEFPSNDTVLHNLLVAQIEFYFSNHHLKRDKPLMEKLCEKPHVGYVTFEDVVAFPKVRTLGQTNEVVEKAVRASRFLNISQDEKNEAMLVGRDQFSPPRVQEFPFRRTVFVYGIPPEHAQSDRWIKENFSCFGTITKVKFDSGKHSLPRKVGARLLSKEQTRVVKLRLRDQAHTEYKFCNKSVVGDKYYCHECNKMKNCKDGFYISDRLMNQNFGGPVFCVQCAAKKAENNLKYFQTRAHGQYRDEIKDLFGIDPQEHGDEMLMNFRTCLVVFESQRQASKCVYVRSRLGIDGCFATHFHNYTRHKREISHGGSLDLSDMNQESDRFALVPRHMGPQRSAAFVETKSFAQRNSMSALGMAPPRMRKHQSTPTRFSRQNNV